MPIYEFYCSDCNTLFNFFSTRVDTRTRPPCPRCHRPEIERRPARFATLRHTASEEEGPLEDPLSGLDDAALDGLMSSIATEMEGLGEREDPRALARVFRRFGEAAGLEPGPRMEDLLARLEAGEDPDALEGELDDGGEEDLEDLFRLKKRLAAGPARRPERDETLYFL